MMKSINLFITHTPFQIYISSQIIHSIQAFSHEDNYLIIECEYDRKYLDESIWSDVIYFDNVGGSTFGREKYSKCENNYKKIQRIINSSENINIFFSDIAWPMNNRLFFDSKLQKKIQYHLISDGLGLYTTPAVTFNLFCRGILKSINGWLNIGAKYRNYFGSQFGLDRFEIKKIYAPCSNLLNNPSHMKINIPLESFSQKTVFDKTKCIFLDQPYWLLVESEDWKEIRNKVVNYIKSLEIRNLFYKNHHKGRVEEENYFKTQGFCLVTDRRCIEEIIIEEGYGTVISYDSSALLNLKVTYQNDIRCIAIYNDMIIKKENGYNENVSKKVFNLFNIVGVEVIRNV